MSAKYVFWTLAVAYRRADALANKLGYLHLSYLAVQRATRECLEETGVSAVVTGFLGVYSDPAHVVAYPDGAIRQEYEVTLVGRPVGGAPAANDEASDVRWVSPAEHDALNIHETMRRQISDYTQASTRTSTEPAVVP
ncbi:MAG TPA: NUDIX domain-containing protein [Mycobacteriales bacterium]|nr:NUDIX domain-containing protein [Mycobacteriales bacterium]